MLRSACSLLAHTVHGAFGVVQRTSPPVLPCLQVRPCLSLSFHRLSLSFHRLSLPFTAVLLQAPELVGEQWRAPAGPETEGCDTSFCEDVEQARASCVCPRALFIRPGTLSSAGRSASTVATCCAFCAPNATCGWACQWA